MLDGVNPSSGQRSNERTGGLARGDGGDERAPADGAGARRAVLDGRLRAVAIVALGIFAGQLFLYGPSLIGRRILLPLDSLTQRTVYLANAPGLTDGRGHNRALSDLVMSYQPARDFAAREMRAGRVPLWSPNSYAGAPFAGFAKYSPFNLLYTAFPVPITLAWMQLIKSLVSGLGLYFYATRALRLSFWPSAVGAWVYPISGFHVLWQGYEVSYGVAWLPWILLVVDSVIRRPNKWGGPSLAVCSALTVLCGQVDVAAQVLLVSGVYALLCLAMERRRIFSRSTARAVATLAIAWGLGLALSAPYVLPLLEYSQSGERIQRRSQGAEERPPLGLSVLPEILLPDLYGTMDGGNVRLRRNSRMEGAPAAYAGLLAALVLVPLAWLSRRHRADTLRWALLGALGTSWLVNLPGVVWLLRQPPLGMLSYNRMTFVTGLAIVLLAATGLEALRREVMLRRVLVGLLAVPPLVFGLWCAYRLVVPPETLLKMFEVVRSGGVYPRIPDLAAMHVVLGRFSAAHAWGALLCVVALAAWLVIAQLVPGRRWLAPALAVGLLVESLVFAYGGSPQVDPALFYPPIPTLQDLSRASPGRVLGIGCLPAQLSETQGLRDIRGYDGVDPGRLMDVMALAADPAVKPPPYAFTQWYVPKRTFERPGSIDLPGVLDMLNVRYAIKRGPLPAGIRPLFAGDGYSVVENPDALPRAYVPRRVVLLADSRARLARLGSDRFDPRKVAFVETPTPVKGPNAGVARITRELPRKVEIEAQLEGPGLVVLADLWDAGWRARVNGIDSPILRVNHALRGVVAPAGSSIIEYRYEPASFEWGVRFALAALGLILVWGVFNVLRVSDAGC